MKESNSNELKPNYTELNPAPNKKTQPHCHSQVILNIAVYQLSIDLELIIHFFHPELWTYIVFFNCDAMFVAWIYETVLVLFTDHLQNI